MTLRELRDSLNYSQEGMARDLGVSLSYYEKIERGNRIASANFIRKVKIKHPNHSVDEMFFTPENYELNRRSDSN